MAVLSQAQALIKQAQTYIGVGQGSARHRHLVDTYNQIKPLPQGYRASYQDDWCDIFVSALAQEAGLGHLVGAECGVQRHVALFIQKGIWYSRQSGFVPQVGDIIVFDWDGAGFADHIGLVSASDGAHVWTIEGNAAHRQVATRRYSLNDWRIKGYARPCYQASQLSAPNKSTHQLIQEVIRGLWGNGAERIQRLKQAGYDPQIIQQGVNQRLLGRL